MAERSDSSRQAGDRRLPREAAALLHRFTALDDRQQLRTYEAISEYLRSRNVSATPDRQLDARAEALAAMERVIAHLKLADPKDLKIKDFDAAPDEIRHGWTSGRVGRAWGSWTFARDAAAGEHARPTARQRALKQALGATRLRVDDYFEGVRAWLETDPPNLAVKSYEAWRVEENPLLPEGQLPHPSFTTIRDQHPFSWETIKKIARGELTVEQAETSARRPMATTSVGEHDLVGLTDAVALTGISRGMLYYRRTGGELPVPVLEIGDRPFWFREDIVAYAAGKPFKRRKFNQLAGIYVTTVEAAAILGVSRGYLDPIRWKPGRPKPKVGGAMKLFLKSEIEAHRDERARRSPPPGRRGYKKRA